MGTVLRFLAPVGIALALLAGSATAQVTTVINFNGRSWETGGNPPSQFGDQLTSVGNITGVRRPLFWSPSRYSYTFDVSGLVSLGEVIYGTTHIVQYSGGKFRIHVDALPSNAAYGVNPPNATSPATFVDGTATYLEGDFSSFMTTYNTATTSGSLMGSLIFTGGNAYPQLASSTGWTVGAQLGRSAQGGYDTDWNGALYLAGPLATEVASWGQIKSLYR
jgi:hypothetical protein